MQKCKGDLRRSCSGKFLDYSLSLASPINIIITGVCGKRNL